MAFGTYVAAPKMFENKKFKPDKPIQKQKNGNQTE